MQNMDAQAPAFKFEKFFSVFQPPSSCEL